VVRCIARYGTSRVAKVVLVGAVTPLMVNQIVPVAASAMV